MFKFLRVPERLFSITMWLVSLAFAGFLVGLGGKIVADMPKLEEGLSAEQFADQKALSAAQETKRAEESRLVELGERQERNRLELEAAKSAYLSAKVGHTNWLAARTATTDPQHDPEVIQRTRDLDALAAKQRVIQEAGEALGRQLLASRQAVAGATRAQTALLAAASDQFSAARLGQELRIFSARLAFALPLLALGGWFLARKRQSDYWPLMRGFVIFAGFTFFVELVPYLPSLGGYVRYVVGIVLTFTIGHFVIKAMRRYLAQRQLVERQTETEKRRALTPEAGLARMAAGVCPGCERHVVSSAADFCVHCGFTMHKPCANCGIRRNAFFRYCSACGFADDQSDNGVTSGAAGVAETVGPASGMR